MGKYETRTHYVPTESLRHTHVTSPPTAELSSRQSQWCPCPSPEQEGCIRLIVGHTKAGDLKLAERVGFEWKQTSNFKNLGGIGWRCKSLRVPVANSYWISIGPAKSDRIARWWSVDLRATRCRGKSMNPRPHLWSAPFLAGQEMPLNAAQVTVKRNLV
jgi:hypothetical protein